MSAHPMRLGSFELLEPLGGGMGIVYRARRDGDDCEVAVKILRQERLLDGDARGRFARELRTLQQLAHESICPVLDGGEIDGIPYFCMPLLEGRTLAAYLDEARRAGHGVEGAGLRLPGPEPAGPLWQGAVLLVATLADAVHAAHQQGLVHRDLKPANVMIGPTGLPKLLDFGLVHAAADRYRELTRTGQVIGTPAYLAPEQLDPRLGPVSAQSDVYSLGAILYETLMLEPPYTGGTRAELFENILSATEPDPGRVRPDLPEALCRLIRCAISRRRQFRYPTAKMLAADLRQVLAGRPVQFRGPSRLQRFLFGMAQRRVTLATAAVPVAMAFLVSISLVRYGDSRQAGERMADLARDAWLGRLELARRSFGVLPPGRPVHVEVLDRWLDQHGHPLQQMPEEVARLLEPQQARFAADAVMDVTARIAFARSVVETTILTHAGTWAVARAEVASDQRYGGLHLVPQVGLVPLGPDPASGLHEFHDRASCDTEVAEPTRDVEGRLQLQPEHGIVFVLIPGGSYSPSGTATVVRLDPYLIGKHEITRAQCARLMRGRDTNLWPLGSAPNGELQTPMHPAENMGFEDLLRCLKRSGMDLPTEVQWERAASYPVSCAEGSLAGDANCNGGEDGYISAAPAGCFPANGAGLHDVIGNIAEYCADGFDEIWQPARDGDGLRSAAVSSVRRVVRGGSYASPRVGITYRGETLADQPKASQGARAFRRLELP